jgi:hypothetical protein
MNVALATTTTRPTYDRWLAEAQSIFRGFDAPAKSPLANGTEAGGRDPPGLKAF